MKHCTADPWTIKAWIAQVHLYGYFFNKYYRSTMYYPRLVGSMGAEPGTWRSTISYTWIFHCSGLNYITWALLKGQPYWHFRIWWQWGGWDVKPSIEVWLETEAFHPFTKMGIRVGMVGKSMGRSSPCQTQCPFLWQGFILLFYHEMKFIKNINYLHSYSKSM